MKSNKKKKVLMYVIVSISFIVLFSIGFFGFTVFNMMNKVQTVEISKTDADLGINLEVQQELKEQKKADDVINIALFGLDQRDLNEAGRSDSIMILSLDKEHNKVKLSSIMRDSYVKINGYGSDKINHAYAFGGPQLAIRTLNENFDMNIRDYVTVNFFSLEKIIDALGGVTIDVKKDEVSVMNDYISEVSAIEKKSPKHLSKSGPQLLNGLQAVAYTRNRYTGNGDYERAERQRRVLKALLEKIQSAGVSSYPSIVSQLLPYVSTSVSKLDMLKIGTDILTSGINTIDQERFPVDGYCNDLLIKDIYYLGFDSDATKDQIRKYIYDDIKPTPKK